MISKFFIDRPVFATVLSIVIVIAGLMSMRGLPVSQYPDIIPPEVSISATYPGASADTLSTTVAAPLEDQINGAPNMMYMRSTASNSGTLAMSVTFAIGTNPDQATIDVNNRVQAALPRLPAEVRAQGVQVRKKSSSILEVVTLFCDHEEYNQLFISNYALLNVIDELKRLPGVGDAAQFGSRDYSIRVWLRPDKLAQYNLAPSDVANAISEQNSQFAAGSFGAQPDKNEMAFTYTATTQGRFTDPKQFEQIILKSNVNGGTLRLKDVARVELGSQDYNLNPKVDAKPAGGFGIYLQPGANALAVTQEVSAKMEELSKRFPPGLKYKIPFDTTKFVKVSIHEVITTFAEAILLVVLVVFLFLQNVRATFIPVMAVPVSLIGTFAGMFLLGFSINLLTLFGLVLAIGIVVDDAIVVLENVERLMRTEHLRPREAAIKAMEEVTGPIIAIVLVLCAVFVPVGFLGGLTGVMYKQFAITIAVSVVISGIVALTLTPALCALLIKPTHGTHQGFVGRLFDKFNQGFEWVTERYMRGVTFLIHHIAISLVLFVAILGALGIMFVRIPSALVPNEDQGYVIVVTNLMPGASLTRTQKVSDEIARRLQAQKETYALFNLTGLDVLSFAQKTSSAVFFVPMTDWTQRTAEESHSEAFAARIGGPMGGGGLMGDIKEAFTIAINPPPITGISITGGFEGYLQSRTGAGTTAIADAMGKVVAAAAKRPELAGVRTTLSANVPQYDIQLDRDKAKAQGVSVSDVFTAMQATFGTYYVNDFTYAGRVFRVNMQSEADFREKPEDLRQVFVKSSAGKLIPLYSLVTVKRIVGPDIVERFNAWPAAKIMGNPAPGYSSGQALQAMEDVVNQTLPGGDWSLAWTGSAYQERAASGTASSAFLFGLIMVFLILAAQYERWSLPIAVILTVPFAVFGAVLAVWLRGLQNDVYFQVGLLTLIGLAAKNAILIVEFAVLEHQAGKSVIDAALSAARLRFRPIVMTSLAFVLGCVPLAIAEGAGAASRHSIGTGVIGGMLAATFIAIFFVPLFYRLVMKLSRDKNPQPTGGKDQAHV